MYYVTCCNCIQKRVFHHILNFYNFSSVLSVQYISLNFSFFFILLYSILRIFCKWYRTFMCLLLSTYIYWRRDVVYLFFFFILVIFVLLPNEMHSVKRSFWNFTTDSFVLCISFSTISYRYDTTSASTITGTSLRWRRR